MPMVRALRLINDLVQGNLSGVALESILASQSRVGELRYMLSLNSMASMVASSQNAVSTIAQSQIAMDIVIEPSNVIFPAILASDAASTVIAASTTAIKIILNNSTARALMFNSSITMTRVVQNANTMAYIASDQNLMSYMFSALSNRKLIYDNPSTAWTPIVNSNVARAYLISNATTTSETSETFNQVNGTKRSALIQQRCTSSSYASQAGPGTATYVTNSTEYIDRFVLVTALAHRLSISAISYPSYITWVSME